MKRRAFLAATAGAAIAPKIEPLPEPKISLLGPSAVFLNDTGIWLYQPGDAIRIGSDPHEYTITSVQEAR